MTQSRLTLLSVFLIPLFAALIFIPFLGEVHLFDWDEVNFAEASREMLLTGEYFRVQINYEPFFEKPPLFNWIQVVSMKIFGVNEFAARFPNALCGMATLLILFLIGKKEFDYRFGLLWSLIYAGTFLSHLYFKSGIIDPIFNLFIFLALYQWTKITSIPREYKSKRNTIAFLGGLFIGLAVLTKGPVGYLIVFLCLIVYLIVKRTWKVIHFREFLIFSATAFLISCFWFGPETVKNGPNFLYEFITYQIRLFRTQDAGHGGPFFYHWIVLLIGCFPASLYIFKSFQKVYSDNYRQKNFKKWMMISFFVALILFSIVKTKIVHYSSFCYFPLTFLATYVLYKVMTRRIYFTNFFNVMFGIFGILIALLLIGFPLFMMYKDQLPLADLIKDPFALANLKAPVKWTGFEVIPGIIYLTAVLVFLFLNKKDSIKAAVVFFTATIIVLEMMMVMIVPRLEGYIQKSVVEFYKESGKQDAYVTAFGYKSYAQFFYSEKKPQSGPESNDMDFLLHGKITKPVFIAGKLGKTTDLDKLPQLKRLREENGYVFYRRDP